MPAPHLIAGDAGTTPYCRGMPAPHLIAGKMPAPHLIAAMPAPHLIAAGMPAPRLIAGKMPAPHLIDAGTTPHCRQDAGTTIHLLPPGCRHHASLPARCRHLLPQMPAPHLIIFHHLLSEVMGLNIGGRRPGEPRSGGSEIPGPRRRPLVCRGPGSRNRGRCSEPPPR